MVNLLSDGAAVRMGKRGRQHRHAGRPRRRRSASTPRATRWSATPSDVNLDIDVDLWTKATSDNPVFYVQYAHARVCSILRNAADLGLERRATRASSHPRACSTHEREGDLLRALAEFPRVVAAAAELREPHRVARYLEDTAAAYHRFYDTCRVLPMGDEEPTDLHRARLLLVDATRVVLANGLALLGVSAPERM